MIVGVLAVQGAFIEHEKMLERLGVRCVELRQASDLQGIDALVLPGGESTVQGQLLHKLGMFEPVRALIASGMPVLATCAGLILLAQHLENDETTHLASIPITVKRNAYGRQLGSFTTSTDVAGLTKYPAVFIRAPYITEVGEGVQVLAQVDGNIVGIEYGNQIALAFHPEMTNDTRIHEYFLNKIRKP